MKRVEGRTMVIIHELLFTVAVLGTIIVGSCNPIAEADDSIAKHGCRSSCGDLSIPYPFGLRDTDPRCHIPPHSFMVHCDYSTDPPVPFWWDRSSHIEILNISVEEHELRINLSPRRECYDSSLKGRSSNFHYSASLAKFRISSAKNKFTAVGCDTSAIFSDSSEKFSFGCISLCSNVSDAISGSCSGIGCCQTSIPRNISGYSIFISSFSSHSNVLESNPCSFAFVTETDFYNFSVGDLSLRNFNKSTVVLDRAIGSQTCEDAQKDITSYMCTGNTTCTNAENGSGYKCTCLKGYQGNPYLEIGCQDIDECADPKKNKCDTVNGQCTNTVGNYNCSCRKGYHDNGRDDKERQQCTPNANVNPSHLVQILVGASTGIIVLLSSAGFLYLGIQKRKLIRLKKQSTSTSTSPLSQTSWGRRSMNPKRKA